MKKISFDNTNYSSVEPEPLPLTQDSNFVNLDQIGLRQSSRLKDNQSKATYADIFCQTSALGLIAEYTYQYFSSQIVLYQEFIDRNFDGTLNSIHPLSLAYLSKSVSGNEVYTYDQMLTQDNKKEFEKAMFKEVQAMFDNKIWENIPRSEIKAYYNKLRSQGINVKRE